MNFRIPLIYFLHPTKKKFWKFSSYVNIGNLNQSDHEITTVNA